MKAFKLTPCQKIPAPHHEPYRLFSYFLDKTCDRGKLVRNSKMHTNYKWHHYCCRSRFWPNCREILRSSRPGEGKMTYHHQENISSTKLAPLEFSCLRIVKDRNDITLVEKIYHLTCRTTATDWRLKIRRKIRNVGFYCYSGCYDFITNIIRQSLFAYGCTPPAEW